MEDQPRPDEISEQPVEGLPTTEPEPVEQASDLPTTEPEPVGQVDDLPTTEPEAPADQPADTLLPQMDERELKAAIEAIVYATEDPVTPAQISAGLHEPADRVSRLLAELVADYSGPEHGVAIREIAGGYKSATKPEHHDAVRAFVRSLKPPLKLSLAALETLAAIAYKQPITAPEIMAIRGVQGAGVLNTLLERKLIKTSGRKNVVGRPILYRTTNEFLVQFGLKDLAELPTLKEFEELRRLAVDEPASEPVLPTTGPEPSPVEQVADPPTIDPDAPAPEAAPPEPPAEEPQSSDPETVPPNPGPGEPDNA
jgi:segregation and condensation protein B